MQNEDNIKTFAASPLDPIEVDAAFIAIRAHADKSIYGKYLSDDECKVMATEVVIAIGNYQRGTAP